jgi:hypothetical protein
MSRINGLGVSLVGLGLAGYQPLTLAGNLPILLNALPIRGAALGIGIAGWVLVAALCASAGLALYNRRAVAPALARSAVVASAGADLCRYLTHVFPSNRPPGSTPIFVATSFALHAAALAYLFLSRQIDDLS